MKKLIKPQDILFMTLAGIGDLFEEVRDPLMLMGKAYENVYGFIPNQYKRNNFLKSVQRSLKTGYIERIEKNGDMYLRLTTAGQKKVHRDFSLLALSKKLWDGKWRLVFFDIEEVSRGVRHRLRTKLKELGFAMLQKSVWITPHDMAKDFYEFFRSTGVDDRVFIIEGKDLLAGNPRELAWRIWKLEELNARYSALAKELEELQLSVRLNDRHSRREERKDEKKVGLGTQQTRLSQSSRVSKLSLDKLKRALKMQYLEILSYEPFLPRELLPTNWMGDRVRREIKRL